MDERQAGRLLGAADSRGQNSQTKTRANRWQPILGRQQPLGSGATEDPAGSSWTVVASETQVTNEWGTLGRWLGLGLGADDRHSSLRGWLCPAGFWASRFNPFIPWLPEHCHGHGRLSTTLGLFVQVWWPGVLQVTQVPSLHRGLKQGWPAGYG